MPLVLNLIYAATLVLFAPLLAYRVIRSGKYREGLWEKFWGDAPRRIGERPCLWFHAVSVGEVLLLQPLVAEMARRRPGWEVVISTTTTTGLSVARRTFPDLITFYAPLDFSWATQRALARIRPTVLALVELELWPNLIRAAKRSGAKVAIINARLSSRSYRGYRRIRGPLRPTLRCIDVVAAQDADYARRFVELGIPEERVSVTGSVKYDGLESDRNNARTRQLRKELGLSHSDLIFVAGSTMEGEEAAALVAYRAARQQHPGLRLIVVPRHALRFESVARFLEENGETVVRRSQLGSGADPVPAVLPSSGSPSPVILIDTIGELAAVWGLADVAFVGGSLIAGRGGQNMIEPAAYGASVLFGPHTANFRETVEQLLSRNAACRVTDASDLSLKLQEDLDDPEAAAARGAAGRSFVLAQHGASGRTLAMLDRLVETSFTQKSA
ncbi:MAG TPA: 3-deoxy-D-manno-octulosonic acid transferase [Isosphaeraceae bacterium]|nr:3-deoxy-D-manno-octulosonic acid transferase [Isosphaeraceae bacterium]